MESIKTLLFKPHTIRVRFLSNIPSPAHDTVVPDIRCLPIAEGRVSILVNLCDNGLVKRGFPATC